ncbi:hypothetical protein GOV10_01635 [Candidatus Woesearchaeota archaeon]|nr:hypothetical protein [Candidatus Woesearchaeota archaeon]
MRIRDKLSDIVDDVLDLTVRGDRTTAVISALVLGIGIHAVVGTARLFYDAQEEFREFPRLEQGYAVTSYYVPTRGDVIMVQRLDGKEYQEISGGRGLCGEEQRFAKDDEVLICGEFLYWIQSDVGVGTVWTTDRHSDIREGYVRLKKVGED